jgi:radical SAM superfamily enzyme YgiQ (UPF0313 family)
MPLGLLTVAALLPGDWELRFVDSNASELDESWIDWADLVLTGGMITQQPETLNVIDAAQARGKRVAVGGPDPTNQPGVYAAADFLVLDEGELTIPAFLEALERGDDKGTFRARGERPNVQEVPPPRYDLIDPGDYLYAGVQYTRGCPFTCEFCDIIELYGRVPRFKTPEQFTAELQLLFDAGHRGHVAIVDDNFIGNKAETKKMLRHLKEWSASRGWPFYFSTQLTITVAQDPELLGLLADCDFRTLLVGIETPEPEVLKTTQKKQNTLEPIVESVRRINEAGMMVMSGFILGFDGEKAGIAESVRRCVEETGIVIAGVGLLMALPETQLERRLEREGRLLRRSEGVTDFGEGRRYDQITQGLNFLPERPRLTILREFRALRETLYSPAGFFRRVRTFLSRFRPHPPKHLPPLRRLPAFVRMYGVATLMVLGRPSMWWEVIKTLAFGCTRGLSGVVGACAMIVYYLHLGPQSRHVIADISEHIDEIERDGEEAYNRRRHLRLVEPPRESVSAPG